MSTWPWPRRIHPCAEEAVAASRDWLRTLHAFNEESQRAFDKYNVGLASALTYPFSSQELLRIGCDLYNLFFVFGHYTDVEDAQACRTMADITMDALYCPYTPRPQDEVALGEITRQFWLRVIESGIVGPVAQRRFIDYFTAYTDSVVEEASDRDAGVYRQVEDYFAIQRDTLGFRPLYALMVLELPDEVVYHPAIVEMVICVIDMLIIDNDLISYNMEQRSGDARHNLVTLTMLEQTLSIHDAITLLFKRHISFQDRFLKAYRSFEPQWDDAINAQLRDALRDLAHFPRGIYCWHFGCGRYFGHKGAEVSVSRDVELLPQVLGARDLKRENVKLLVMDEF
ncbi:hypothetical protein FOMPIDRAFT_84975 [Fomitopsis schrenkii]|uniref:Terpene synthase n=1 Tax=Fomitopsis schrenkii TaxID=2126942 RepID=S8DPI9_FOMSC|nr:hypothetical protein FOMPIDRAFT_84975 [Fomitopsis schrenkii]